MSTVAERLQFVIRFIQMNLDVLRPGDWLNLRDDLDEFLRGGKKDEPRTANIYASGAGKLLYAETTESVSTYPEESFHSLQEETRKIFQAMLGPSQRGKPDVIPITNISTGWALFNFALVAGQASGPPANLFQITGTIRDLFLQIVYLLLIWEDTDRIKRCPECQSPFYRVRKQKYCSRQCVTRANARSWRATPEGKKRQAARARERYRKRIKTEKGRNVRVTRRGGNGKTSSQS